MVDAPQLPDVLAVVNDCKKQVLLIAESSLPASQFAAYRKFVLNAFGEKGLEGDLKVLFTKDSKGKARHGRE